MWANTDFFHLEVRKLKKQEQSFELKIQATLEGMNKVVSELNKGLKEGNTKIDLSKGIGKSLSKQLDSFKEEYSKLTTLTKDNKFELADAKEVMRSGEAIIDAFKEIKRLVGDFDDLTLLDAKKLFPDAFNSQVDETRNKFESLRKSLIDLNDKKLSLDDASTKLKELQTTQKTALEELEQARSVVIDTEGAQQQLAAAQEKVAALKEELKELLGIKLSEKESRNLQLEGRREEILQARQARGATQPLRTAAQARNAKASEEEVNAIALYEKEEKELAKIGKEIANNKKEADGFRKALLGADKSPINKLAEEAEASRDKIAEVTKATKNLNDAQKQQEKTSADFKEQAEKVKQAEEAYNSATKAVERQEESVDKLKTSYENLRDKINPEELKSAFAALNIDFSEDMVRDEQAVEELRQKLDALTQVDFNKLIASLKQMGINVDNTEELVKQLKTAFGGAEDALKDFTETQKEIERLKNSILDFFSITNTISILKRTVNSATESIKALDAVMTEAAVVTDFSIGDMWEQMPQYSKNASGLGVATRDLYSATTLYYQQGLKGNEVMKVGAETMKMARIAGMDAAEATQDMTAALRGFNMQVNEMNARKVSDVYSKLAAITAADTSQIATAMGKTASIAASANMEFETTAAFLAQIIETTQEAPETAGTALKTIIARFSEVKNLQNQGLTSGVDAEGEAIDLNKISTALRSVGISMDAFFAGQEGLDSVLMRLSEKWDTLDFTTQRYIATAAAGSRQQSRFIAMMSNYGRTMELVNEANNSAGASQEQYEKTLESLDAKLTQLRNAWEQFTMGLANNELLKFGVDVLTGVLTTVNKITDAISGGSGLIKSLSSLITVIGAFKLGSKILGKKDGTGGIFGKIGGLTSTFKDSSKREYQRGLKDGKSYGEGWGDGLKSAVQDIPPPEMPKPSGKDELGEYREKLEGISVAALGVGTALGALSAIFKTVGMDQAALATGELAKAFTVMGTIVPVVGQAVKIAGLEGAAAWAWAAGASAAIAILAVGISHALSAAKKNTLEYKLEQAQKATEETKEAAEEAKAAYDDLLNSKNEYSELQKTLKNLTKGTKEWKAALVDTNQQVIELIEKYPELTSMKDAISYEGGKLTISDSAWEEITLLALERSQAAQAAYIGASIDQTGLQLQDRFSEMAKSSGGGFSTSEMEELYSIATITDSSERQEQVDRKKSALEGRIKELEKHSVAGGSVAAVASSIATSLQKKIDFLNNGLDKFANEYAQKMEVFTSQLESYTKALMIYTKEETQESPIYDKIVQAIADNKGDMMYEELKKEQGRIMAQGEDAIREQYFVLTGQEAAADANVGDLARDLAIDNLSKQLSDNVDELVKLLSTRTSSQQNILASAVSGNTSGLTMSELNELSRMDFDQLMSGYGFWSEDYNDVTDFYNKTGLTESSYAENQEIYKETYRKLIEGIGKSAYYANFDFLQGLTLESLEKLGSQIAAGNLSTPQSNNLIKALQGVLSSETLSSDDKIELENLFANTVWTDVSSRMNAMDVMFGKGLDKKTIVEYWVAATDGANDYIDSEEEALQLASRMQGKVAEMTELSERLSSGKATAQDLSMLQKIGIDTSKYSLTAEGWKATAAETEEATKKMQEYYVLQAELEKQRLMIDLGLGEDSEEVKNVQKIIDMLQQPITTTYNVKTHIDLLDRIKDAIVFDRQKEIDKLSEINDTISDSNSRIVTAMRESVEKSRRQRENEKIEESIAEKQSRLAYLKMDTSGANALEIKRLEDEIAQEQESYTDRLIDEKISALEEQNNIAQEQRAQQIELMQLQLEQSQESGAFWSRVNELIEQGFDEEGGLKEDSELLRLLKQAEGYEGLSKEAQEDWKNTLVEAFKESVQLPPIEFHLEFTWPNKDNNVPSGFTLSTSKNNEFLPVQGIYATDGLADFTGPAWLDGSKTHPEYVLSAQQTERFFELIDILGELKTGANNSTQNNRENNFDIDINVESIGSDYDVEQVANKVKDLIVNSSRYRNVNALT